MDNRTHPEDAEPGPRRRAGTADITLMAALEALPEGFVLYDAEDRLIACNAKFREFHAGSEPVVAPGTRFADHVRACAYSGLVVQALGREEEWIAQRIADHRDPQGTRDWQLGDGRWVRVCERRTSDGGTVGIWTEITEFEEQARALRESEAQLRLLTDAMPVFIADIDPDERYRFVNRIAESWHRRPRQRIIGQRMSEILPEPTYTMVRPWMERARAGQTVTFEARLAYPDGTKRDVQITYVPHMDDTGRLLGVFGLAEDTTALKEAEEQVRQFQKVQAIGQLTGGVAHDFNNLLGVVLGNLELLEQRLRGDQFATQLTANAIKATLRGSELTQRLLAYSRKQDLRPQVIDLAKLIPHTIELLRRTIPESIRIDTALPEGLWCALVDPGQLETALLNLAINARDAMPDGGGIVIEAANTHLDQDYAGRHRGVSPGDYVMIAVRDTGTGMPPEVIEHAFDPFFTTKEVGSGSGLGLSMVYGFVTQSGGHIEISSELGRGSSVELYLPKTAAAETVEDTDSTVPEVPGGSETVLVVEDNPALRRLAVALLDNLGYTVHAADTAESAMSVLQETPDIDLLFTDVILPGGTHGTELARWARQRHPRLKVLLTSGHAQSSLGRLGMDTEVQLLHKPYRRKDLAQKVRAALDGACEGRAGAAAGP